MNFPFFIAKRISSSSTSGYSGSLIKLAVATISLSIAVVLLTSFIIKGFKTGVSEKIYGFWGNIHITDIHSTRNFELKPIIHDKALMDSILSIGQIEYQSTSKNASLTLKSTEGGVSSVSSFITYPGILSGSSEMEGLIFKGIDKEYNVEQFQQYLLEGQFPNLSDTVSSREILISKQTAQRLQLVVDDRITINFLKDQNPVKRRCRISGLYRTGLEEYDRKFAFIDKRMLQNILNWEAYQVSGYEIQVEAVEDAPVIADYIYDELLPPNMYAETIQEKQSSIFEWLELQDINEAVALFLMTIVAIINMTTVLLILILERSAMIGVLKALGQTDWSLRKIFIYNALYILGLAMLFGNLLGLGIAFLQKQTGILKLDETNYYLSTVPIEFDFSSFIAINIGAVIVTAFVMLIPTFLITRISPIDILRFD